jgi:uncharacterized repeat protein (TIGR01451 family)
MVRRRVSKSWRAHQSRGALALLASGYLSVVGCGLNGKDGLLAPDAGPTGLDGSAATTTDGGSSGPSDAGNGADGATNSDASPSAPVQDGALLISSALSLSETTVHPGDTVTGTVTFTNNGTASVAVQAIVIAGRPPGGTHTGGPFDNFAPPSAAQMLAPGASVTVTATRTFTAADPTGAWDAYPTWEDSANAWHDGPDSSLTVTAAANDGGENVSPTVAPQVIPATGGAGAHLVTVGSTNRLELHGVVVWGIQDFITGSFANDQHTNRDAIAANIAASGGNVIRLRVLADEYIHLTLMGSDANYLQWIKDWVASAEAQNLYVQICWWDSLDSQNEKNDANWASQYAYAFPMMADVHDALKLAGGSDDPRVFYEPFNEPNNVSWDQWLPAMKAAVSQFRTTAGYQGMLIIDTTTWSHDYSDQYMGELEAYDATLTSAGQPNIVFARHDYTNDYGNNFTGGAWIANTGGTETAHVIYETEFGNYNGPGIQSNGWSAAITSYFKTDLFDRSNVAGADAFLFGNWSDANAMSSDPSGNAPTNPWGNDVQNWLGAYK